VIFFNFRADRVRQLSMAIGFQIFDAFPRPLFSNIHVVTMTQYRDDFPFPVAFAPQERVDIFPEIIAREGMNQLRIAETEKYAHVTFFFGGGVERILPGEERVLIPSPNVATYDLKPEMSALEVTDRLLAEIYRDHHHVIILNFANPDMVGHTGNLDAAIRAVKTVDACLARIVPEILKRSGTLVITADHGNCEMMVDPETGGPHTAHTTNPVPLILCSERFRSRKLKKDASLPEIAPTLLDILNLKKPEVMTAESVLLPETQTARP
jgi:2,3-bisphosphoglycerate-independent phosphoglycerate mutase